MRRACVMAAVLVLISGTVDAQPRDRPVRRQPTRSAGPVDERVRVVVNAGGLVGARTFGQDFTLVKNVEDARVTTDMKPGASGFFEVGARARVARSLWIGAVGFSSSGSATGTIEAQVPHPFYFGRPRTVSGDLKRHTRSITGGHVEIAYAVSRADNREIAVFGGPSYMILEQDLVTDFTYADSYPYDTAEFQSETKATANKGGVGFNAGAEAMWRFGRRIWAGGIARYSVATLVLSPADGNSVEMKAGGIQVGAGVRVGF